VRSRAKAVYMECGGFGSCQDVGRRARPRGLRKLDDPLRVKGMPDRRDGFEGVWIAVFGEIAAGLGDAQAKEVVFQLGCGRLERPVRRGRIGGIWPLHRIVRHGKVAHRASQWS
jgi:hypothetical protein